MSALTGPLYWVQLGKATDALAFLVFFFFFFNQWFVFVTVSFYCGLLIPTFDSGAFSAEQPLPLFC